MFASQCSSFFPQLGIYRKAVQIFSIYDPCFVFRAGELGMPTLSRRISCLSTTTRNKAWCLMESLNSLWMRWGNRSQQPSASLDTRGELDRSITWIQTLCLVGKKCVIDAMQDAVTWMCLFCLATVHTSYIIFISFSESVGLLVNSVYKHRKILLKS